MLCAKQFQEFLSRWANFKSMLGVIWLFSSFCLNEEMTLVQILWLPLSFEFIIPQVSLTGLPFSLANSLVKDIFP